MTDLSAIFLRWQDTEARTLFGPSLAKFVALAMVGFSLVTAASLQANLTGAIFTTDIGCTGVNINIYTDKDAVYLDGGPAHPGAAGLPGGTYYVKVTEPDGTLLGTSVGSLVPMPFEVDVNGEPVACYQLSTILVKASEPTQLGYDTTSNPGGEYKVWVSTDPNFAESQSKTDNFKVKSSEVVTPIAKLCVEKFYDANVNGEPDEGELLITGWKVLIRDGISLTRFTPVCVTVEATNPVTNTPLYNVFEFPAVEKNWIHTTQQTASDIALTPNETTTVMFGNVCVGTGGGKTLGFWSNKNGQSLFGADDLALMVSLNIRTSAGDGFNPTSYAAFRTWILGATATNMAYMLSAQLAAMELNVLNGNVNGAAMIYAPGTASENPLGFATINAVMAEANAELKVHGIALSSDPWRSCQELLKNTLDQANNNKNFVQNEPCAFTFAEE